MRYEIRPVEPAEWEQSRELRLTALLDPVAPIAFARTHAEESAMSDDEWRARASGVGAQQFVAILSGGEDYFDEWVGMTVVIEEGPDRFTLNAVYLVPEARGSGVADRLCGAAIDWGWERTDRLYLWVHEKNVRAQGFYRRLGFEATGESMASPVDPAFTEYEWVLRREG